jgi:hypothetical protein
MLYDFIGLLVKDEITCSWFQQADATAHTTNSSMKLLNEVFGEHVISTNLWRLRSPILLHQSSKSVVYMIAYTGLMI